MTVRRCRAAIFVMLSVSSACADLLGADFDERATASLGEVTDDAGSEAPHEDAAERSDVGAGETRKPVTAVDGNVAADANAPGAAVVPGLQLGGGDRYSCAITAANGTQCWGDMMEYDTPEPPRQMFAASTAIAVAPGAAHVCARTLAGSLLCAGSNRHRQLAQEDTTDRRWPATPIAGLPGVVRDVAAGWRHTCAIDGNGALWCWGRNAAGQLGDNTTTDRATPALVNGMDGNVTAVAATSAHTCAIKGGALFCWGDNSGGALGDGTTSDRMVPQPVKNMASGVASVSVAYDHTCAVTLSGQLFCWGWNEDGQLGDLTNENRLEPTLVTGLPGPVTFVRTGSFHTCALVGGAAYCWGYNGSGQLGNGTNASSNSPARVAALSGLVAISAGHRHTCAMTGNDEVYCWGSNGHGQVRSSPDTCMNGDAGVPCARNPSLVTGL